jgi:hypothetical protein
VDECGVYFQCLIHELFKNLFEFAKTGFTLTTICLDTIMVPKDSGGCLLVLPLAIVESRYVSSKDLDHLYPDIAGKENLHARYFAMIMCQRVLNDIAALLLAPGRSSEGILNFKERKFMKVLDDDIEELTSNLGVDEEYTSVPATVPFWDTVAKRWGKP